MTELDTFLESLLIASAPNPTELARRPLYREGLLTSERHVLVCVDCSLVCDAAERECARCSSERLQRVQR